MDGAMILIPSRMASIRLPGKPLADIHGVPMITHVWRRAVEAAIGRVVVATDSTEIAAAIRDAGGEAQMTRADHQNGTDRIFEAIAGLDPERNFRFIINVQGDLPTLEPRLIRTCLDVLIAEPAADIATLACAITLEEERTNPNVVKAVGTPIGPNRLRALYFTRATAPTGDGPLYHHIGMYAYTRAAIERFVALPPAPLEQRERLEQLRALEAGMRIDIGLVDTVPLGVDTPADLERARRLLAPA
jgi:3-deoxy-manno-octulosonate cytidylyltransferase (CMP-KDO synthetase)